MNLISLLMTEKFLCRVEIKNRRNNQEKKPNGFRVPLAFKTRLKSSMLEKKIIFGKCEFQMLIYTSWLSLVSTLWKLGYKNQRNGKVALTKILDEAPVVYIMSNEWLKVNCMTYRKYLSCRDVPLRIITKLVIIYFTISRHVGSFADKKYSWSRSHLLNHHFDAHIKQIFVIIEAQLIAFKPNQLKLTNS